MRTAARLAAGLGLLVLVGWAAGALWTALVGSGEVDVMRTVAANRTGALTAVAKVVTWAGSAVVLVPLAAVACLLLLRGGLQREALAVAVSLGGAIVLWHAVKLPTGRARPPVEHLVSVTGSSFPSGHATQAGAFWISLALALRAARISRALANALLGAAAAIVLVVACSRVYLGVHYPSDVFAGALLGGGWAVYVARVLHAEAP